VRAWLLFFAGDRLNRLIVVLLWCTAAKQLSHLVHLRVMIAPAKQCAVRCGPQWLKLLHIGLYNAHPTLNDININWFLAMKALG